MEENICKQWDRKGIDLQNLQTAQAAQYIYIFRKKTNQTAQSKNGQKI